MKNRLLSLLTAALAATLFTAAPVFAQDDKKEEKEKPKQEEKQEEHGDGGEEEERPEFNPEEFKKRMKEEEKEARATVQKMLRVFKPLEGEWTGTEKVEHSEDAFKALDKHWKDEWKGFYTFEGMYFEMTGQTQGEDPTQYRWICTWDIAEETYKAWYFGANGQTLYTGELSGDGKHVVWSTENEESGSSTKFTMIPDGDRVTCEGKDRLNGRIWSRQSSSYTRKRVAI